ncbi:NAD+ synthase (glutamine-hydrolysing) [Cyclonatronum proteinivorum]|uniref:Glutamine-dependent NAD(+) synthetase n=1 Tax=Cyclonatronum proteinivorum TaxID=1457365 RepID=A0A345UMT3_9BACT|nr:NAD+ synthase [Cyclonatronum proteinivorum]AXJ01785.1 NAD+ synthase (glutamine-hydrolysing) [Cyclonatronum proteinivorum]
MKIRLAQLNPTIGDISGNLRLMREAYETALQDEVDLLVFPELCVCGYPPLDLLERRDFIRSIERHVEDFIASTGETGVIFGSPVRNRNGAGRPLYNAALLAQHGKILQTARKSLLPTYDVFDEFRYFEPETSRKTVSFKGVKLGITICEDIWNNENEVIYHVYDINPAEELKRDGAEVLINISASPFTQKKPELRARMLQNHAEKLELPIIYVNQAGANTELIFDGDSMALNARGEIICRAALFGTGTEDVTLFKKDGRWDTEGPAAEVQLPARPERLFRALVMGLRDYLRKTAFGSKVVLGLSGGIDSALVSVIAAEALGPENVTAITMPSAFSSGGSVEDSRVLAENLGIQFEQIPIKNLYDAYLHALAPLFEGTAFGIAEENLQSRSRGVLLMAVSNKFGHMLLNTGNKSEMAVGYCTLYGDMAGGLSVLADVYKTEVFEMCRWLNDSWYGRELIPNAIITKPPSAELRPDQKDTDSLPEYDVLDAILYRYIELQQSREEITKALQEVDEAEIRRVLRLVDLNEYKRRQAAPGLRVSAKAFGSGRRLPIVQQWTSQT